MTQNNHEIIQAGELYRILPDGRWEIYIDHSKLNSFMKCEQLFYYRHILNIAPRGELPWSTAFGSWWSSTMELAYDYVMKYSCAPSIDTLLTFGNNAWDAHEMDKRYAQKDDYQSFDGRRGLVRILSEYYPTLVGDSHNWKVIAVEAGFGRKKEVCIGENDKVVVYYIGKPDLVVMEIVSNRLVPLDHKTKDYIKGNLLYQFKPHAQTTGYIVVTEVLARQLGINTVVDRCIISIAGRKPPTEKPQKGKERKERFTRVYPHYSQEELCEWRENLVRKATRLRYCVENNEWLWKEDSCHLYGGCSFRDIDAVTPGARRLVIDTKFVRIEPWLPYEVGE